MEADVFISDENKLELVKATCEAKDIRKKILKLYSAFVKT